MKSLFWYFCFYYWHLINLHQLQNKLLIKCKISLDSTKETDLLACDGCLAFREIVKVSHNPAINLGPSRSHFRTSLQEATIDSEQGISSWQFQMRTLLPDIHSFVERLCDAAWNNQLEEMRQIMREKSAFKLIGKTNERGMLLKKSLYFF